MIKTKAIALEKQTYLRLLLSHRMKRVWYMYPIPFAGALLAYLLLDESSIPRFLLIFGVVYPLWQFIYLLMHINSNQAEHVMMKRHYEFDEDEIRSYISDGTESSFSIEGIREIKSNKHEWLMYLDKGAFIYIPKTAISEEDQDEFQRLLKLK